LPDGSIASGKVSDPDRQLARYGWKANASNPSTFSEVSPPIAA